MISSLSPRNIPYHNPGPSKPGPSKPGPSKHGPSKPGPSKPGPQHNTTKGVRKRLNTTLKQQITTLIEEQKDQYNPQDTTHQQLEMKAYISNLLIYLKSKDISKSLFQYFEELLNIDTIDGKNYYFNSSNNTRTPMTKLDLSKKDNILVILDPNFQSKISSINSQFSEKTQIKEKDLTDYIETAIGIVRTKYQTIKDLNQTKLKINVVSNDTYRQRLNEKKQLYTDIIEDPITLNQLADLLGIKGDIDEKREHIRKIIFEDHTFDYDELVNIKKREDGTVYDKTYNPYIHNFIEFMREYKNERPNIQMQDLFDKKIYKKTTFISPRDYKVESNDDDLEKVSDLVSGEYQILEFLLRRNIINHTFTPDEITNILLKYRTCMAGSFDDIYKIFQSNSKYFDFFPFFKISECYHQEGEKKGEKKEICIKNVGWNISNNKDGIANATYRNLIFPIGIIQNEMNRYNTYELDINTIIGMFCFRILDDYGKYFYYCFYISIIKDPFTDKTAISLFDIFNGRVYLKDSPIGTKKIQYDEARVAINRILNILLTNKVIPEIKYKEDECDLKVFIREHEGTIEKNIYLFSLYNKAQIIEMYTELQNVLREYNNDELNSLMEQIIANIHKLKQNNEYRQNISRIKEDHLLGIDRKDKKFIWNMSIEETQRQIPTRGIRTELCLSSYEYYPIYIDNPVEYAFYKGDEEIGPRELNLDIKLGIPFKFIADLEKYHKDQEYREHIDKQIELISKDREDGEKDIHRYKYEKSIYNVKFPEEDIISTPNYLNLITGKTFYSRHYKYKQYVLTLSDNVKIFYKVRDYVQNDRFRAFIDEIRATLHRNGLLCSYYTKYLKYKYKYLQLRNN